MFHNGGNLSSSCNNMSSTSTPHCHPRGVSVPCIDTRASMPKAGTALQCDGWLTPPQSAHESRRPSLAHSSYSEMPYSAASTGPGFSLPSTPSRSVPDHRQSNHTSHSLSRGHINLDLGVSLGNSHISQDLVHLNLESPPGCELEYDASWPAHPVISDSADDFHNHFDSGNAENMWQMHQAPDQSFLQQPNGLQATLFPVSHGMTANHHDMPFTYDSAACSLNSHVINFSTLQVNTFPAEIVEPSQVNPEHDYVDQHYPMFESPGSSPQDLSASFSSGVCSSFEEIHTPDPEMNYCEESDGYVHIKPETETSPMSVPERKSGRLRVGPRKAAKRFKNRRTYNTANGIEVQVEGENVTFENDRLVCSDLGISQKPCVCVHILPDGRRCDVRFQRSEHLKRHLLSHSDIRKFPCVLPGCSKKISRSDNACDHFRTHLQPGKKNKRNDPFHWREVERRIKWAYEDKAASKIIVNLERWLEKVCLDDELIRMAHEDDKWEPNNSPMKSFTVDGEDE